MRLRVLPNLAVLTMLLVTGAAIASPASAADTAPPPPAQHVHAGPITLDLAVDAASIDVAHTLTVTLTVLAPTDVECTLPSSQTSGEKLGPWTIAAVRDLPPRAAVDPKTPGITLVRQLTLEPFLAGEYALPALEVAWKSRTGGTSGTARTEPLTIPVTSLLPARKPDEKPDPKDLDPGTLRDEVQPSTSHWHRLLAVGGTLAGVCLFGVIGARWVSRRRRHRRDPVDAAFALVSASRDVPRDATSLGLACDDYAAAIRTALADRIDAAAASLTPTELAAFPALRASLPEARTLAVIELLARLDSLRFSGCVIAAHEFESLRGTTIDLVGTLHALPRRGDGGAA